MPLVRLDVPDHLPRETVVALADAVHAALVATAGVPPADRFQVIQRHRPPDLIVDPAFLDIARGPEAVVVSITFRRGRSDDQKRALFRAIAAGASVVTGGGHGPLNHGHAPRSTQLLDLPAT